MKTFRHWKLNLDESQLLWVGLDRQNLQVNCIQDEVLDELAEIIQKTPQETSAKALILHSCKASGFCFGADVNYFEKFSSETQTRGFLEKGHQVFNALETLTIPTIALIDGLCLGGGLEMALACQYLIASDDSKTKLGLPEVKLGIHPGWGGSIRLTERIGVVAAMDMMLSGRMVAAKAALKIRLIDALVPRRQLKHAAESFAEKKPARREPPFYDSILQAPTIRPWFGKFLNAQLRKKARQEHYPAPFRLISLWEKSDLTREQRLQEEIESVSQLFYEETTRNLIRVFQLQERLKTTAKVEKRIQRVHVIGAGTMGAEIAAWCALSGLNVSLQDQTPEYIAKGLQRAAETFSKKLKNPRLEQAAMDRLLPDLQGHCIPQADLIIEAVVEDLAVKQAIFTDLERRARSDALFATNTSSIPLESIGKALKQPERLIGIHFFNPVPLMPLVEIVVPVLKNDEAVKVAMGFVRQIDKYPLPVKSSPGFLINRILMPYLMEAVVLLEEGVSASLIDEAAVAFGMPMGPIELADTVGLDVCLSVANNLTRHFGGQVPERLQSMVLAGKLGRKTGSGFYEFRKGKAIKPLSDDPVQAPRRQEIQDRLILRMLNEAMACLREKIVSDQDLLDIGMILGTGFAPFRGGPIQYALKTGVLRVTDQLKTLQNQHGNRFEVDPNWKQFEKVSDSVS